MENCYPYCTPGVKPFEIIIAILVLNGMPRRFGRICKLWTDSNYNGRL